MNLENRMITLQLKSKAVVKIKKKNIIFLTIVKKN